MLLATYYAPRMILHQLKVLLLAAFVVGLAFADYNIGVVLNIQFQGAENTLADGSCCNSSCLSDQSCCNTTNTTCSPTLRLCFRESQHPIEDTESSCPLMEIQRNSANGALIVFGTDSPPISTAYAGGFQVYIRISNQMGENPDFTPPFTDPLIDEVFLEFTLPAVLFDDRLDTITQTLNITGRFGRAAGTMVANVHCAEGWNGTACEIFCNTTTATCDPPITARPTTVTPPTTRPTTVTPPIPTVAPNTGPLEQTPIRFNIIGLAVGVSLGVVVLIVGVFLLIIAIVTQCKRKSKREWTPKTVPYTVKPRPKPDIQVMQGQTGEQSGATNLYATVNKEAPPPVPPYNAEYTPMQDMQAVIYENQSTSNSQNNP